MFEAMRVRSPTEGSGMMLDRMVNIAAPMQINMLVRIPALLR